MDTNKTIHEIAARYIQSIQSTDADLKKLKENYSKLIKATKIIYPTKERQWIQK